MYVLYFMQLITHMVDSGRLVQLQCSQFPVSAHLECLPSALSSHALDGSLLLRTFQNLEKFVRLGCFGFCGVLERAHAKQNCDF